MDDIAQLQKMISNALLMEKNNIRHRIFHEKICEWCPYAGPEKECEDYDLEERVLSDKRHRVIS